MRNTEVKNLDATYWNDTDNGSKQDKQLLIISDEYFSADEIDFFPSAISDSCNLVLL